MGKLVVTQSTGVTMAEYLNVKGAADFLGVSESYLNKLRCLSSEGPRYATFGRSIRYAVEDLEAWARARKRRSTTDRGAA